MAVVQALFIASDAGSLWEEGLRLVEPWAPPSALRVLAKRLLERYPESDVAITALARAEAHEFRVASEERDGKLKVAREASQVGDWRHARDTLVSVPQERRDGEIWNLLARAHEALGEAEESLRCYETVSQTTDSLAGRARSLARLTRFDDTRRALELLFERLQPEEEPELGKDMNVKGLWAEVRGDLQKAAICYEDEELLQSLVEKARGQNDMLVELEALSNLAGHRSEFVDQLMTRVRAFENRLSLRRKARFVHGRMPTIILCDTNVLLSRLLKGVTLPEELQALGRSRGAERFDVLRSGKEDTELAITETVAGELRSLLKYHIAILEDEDAEKVLGEVVQRAEQLVSEIHIGRVARLSPRPTPDCMERVRLFYKSLGPRLRAITARKVRRRPERSSDILRRRGVTRKRPGRDPMPEAVDQRLLAEAASLVDGPLPGFCGVGILSDDSDFRSFAREIDGTFGVKIC